MTEQQTDAPEAPGTQVVQPSTDFNSATDETFDYPADTPQADMTPEQRAEYWREKAQKHEREWRAVKGTEPAELKRRLKAAEDDLAKFRQAQMTEQEKAVEAARNEGRAAALKDANEGAVRAILKANLTARGKSSEEADEILAALSPSAFVNDDGPDADKVTAFVTRIAGQIQAQHQQVDLGQGPRSGGPKSEEDTVYEALYGSGR